jgi:hypothetical protein
MGMSRGLRLAADPVVVEARLSLLKMLELD